MPDAVKKCQSAGIGVKIVTGDTPGTATEIARQIGLWQPEDTERNRITGVEFAALSDEDQLTINVVALLSVLLGAFFGTELPLTVTQMLWVNLIMDTFAAMALASISPSMDVMNEKPRKRTDFIITPAMRNNILGVGLGFLVILMGLLAYFKTLPGGMDVHHLTVFFTIFVMLQFWNLFNASVFGTNHSIFKDASHALGMLSVALIILVGQFLIVTFGGKVFRTEPLPLMEWLYIIGGTSIVLWIGEIWRGIQRLKKN